MIFQAESVNNLNIHIRVKLLKLFKACSGTRYLANMLLSAVKIAREVSPSYGMRIVKSHGIRPSEDQVLCCLNTKTTKANNEDLHLD